MSDVECVASQAHRNRPDVARILDAIKAGASAAGRGVSTVAQPSGDARTVVVWGAGHPDIRAAMDDALANGSRVIAWDLGYWQRGTHYRCSVDAVHPQAIIMAKEMPFNRFDRLGIRLRSDWNPDGHIVLVGMGWKCARMYGEPVGQWERRTAAAIATHFPARPIHFRPRPSGINHCAHVDGCLTRNGGAIEAVLNGASLVVTRHSNVAVDAIVAGIPVVAMDGAASAVCPTRLEDAGGPLPDDVRLRFLRNLAWFNWSLDEMREASTWETIEGMMA